MHANGKSLVTPVLLALALALPVGARAQAKAAPAATRSASTPRNRVEQRIADMYATLHITPAQNMIWNQFAQVMLDNAASMQAAAKQAEANDARQTAEEILANYANLAQQHAENVIRLSAAFNILYSTLSPEQKQAADEMFRARDEKRETKKNSG
jgi:glucose dehydrogenase